MDDEESPSSQINKEKAMANINVKDIEKIVFANNYIGKDATNHMDGIKAARDAYKEEDSYVNPSNVSYNESGIDYDKNIKSFNGTAIHKPQNNNNKN